MARAELTLEPSARTRIINFLAMSALRHPRTDVVIHADDRKDKPLWLTCGDMRLDLEKADG